MLGEIIYIPRFSLLNDLYQEGACLAPFKKSSTKHKKIPYIPCLFLPYSSGSSKLLIYFHGNAEDIGLSYEMLDHLRSSLKINVLAVEYPNYGIYEDPDGCNSEKITEDAVYVFEYVM